MFKSVTSQAVVAIVALVLGAASWQASVRDAQVAEAMRALVTFQAGPAAEQLGAIVPPSRLAAWLPGVASSSERVGRARAAAGYWNGTGEVAAADDPLVAANAAYRSVMRDGGDAATLVSRLDGVVKQYADVLRADPGSADAAFNYEFVVRYRAAIAARRQAMPPAAADEGLTMHGRAGAPPKGTDTRSFKMIVPMRPDERQQAEEAGRSGKRARKG
ncbi:MAG: hypothetical protein JNM38_21390 [Acidobacteria bacterium]|nr:hypothetical protein [Acidobacteriota bacterium]